MIIIKIDHMLLTWIHATLEGNEVNWEECILKNERSLKLTTSEDGTLDEWPSQRSPSPPPPTDPNEAI